MKAIMPRALKHRVRELRQEQTIPDDEAAVINRAVEVIGDKRDAMRWMGTPIRALDYATPVSLLSTRKGRQTVTEVLGRLEHGVL
jgi:putative toxin-antitoxin system antitoxin component (TIGR02293 family)